MSAYLELCKLSLAEVKAGDVIAFPLFPIGNWKSAKYPNLPLTRELAETLIANFEAGVLGTEPVLDSSGKHDTSAPAAGWFKRLHVEATEDGGEMLFGDTRLTDLGAELLNSELYRYGSIEIDNVVDNRTGEKTPNVFKSATLTNTPVLRIMPSVLDAADHIAVALSEITAVDVVDPVQELLDDLEAVAGKLDESLKGKKGMPSARAFLREIRAKVSAYKMSEGSYNDLRSALEAALGGDSYVVDFGDDWLIYERWGATGATGDGSTYRVAYVQDEMGITLGSPVEVKRVTNYVPVTLSDSDPAPLLPADSPAGSHHAKGEEGDGLKASEGPAAQKGVDPDMKTVLEALKLAEGADETTVLAAVKSLIDERDTATVKLAEVTKAARDAAVEVTLSELIKGGHVAPGQKDTWLKLSEAAPEQFDAMVEAAKLQKVIDLSEHGAPREDDEFDVDPGAAIVAKAAEIAKERGVSEADALDLALSENPELKAAYVASIGDSRE